MKLVHSEYHLDIDFHENEIIILVIECRNMMMEMMRDLHVQYTGQEGLFVLSDSTKILKIDKEVELIINPFSLNCNERKILASLFHEIEELTLENYSKESIELNALIANYVEKISSQVSYHTKFHMEYSPSMLLKLVDLQIEADAVTLTEKIVEYITLMKRMRNVKLFIFWNLKTLLNDDEIKKLYEHAINNKIELLLIESSFYPKITGEKTTIIDKDGCIIVT